MDWYIAAILDNGWPAVFVDGDPERDGVSTEVVLDVDLFGPSRHVDSAHGAGPPPAATARSSRTPARRARVPVELLTFSVE